MLDTLIFVKDVSNIEMLSSVNDVSNAFDAFIHTWHITCQRHLCL